MKKLVLAFVLAAMTFFVASCSTGGLTDSVTAEYKLIYDGSGLVTEEDENVIEVGEFFDISGLSVEVTTVLLGEFSSTETLPVTEDMILGDYSTDTVGERSIIIKVAEKELELVFHVKYAVEFVAGNTLIDKQYLAEGEAPVAPDVTEYVPEGMHFTGWNPEIPDSVTKSTVFRAQFEENSYTPSLSVLGASYGQTLSELTLPSNSYGEWKFVDDISTPVGSVGNQEFAVIFVPFEEGGETVNDNVTVKVSKAVIDFADIITTFTYDGTEKFPVYTVPEGVTVFEMGESNINVGTYDFYLRVNSTNYEGSYVGKYRITKANVEITIPDYELDFDEAKTFMPSEYEVSGDYASLLGDVELVKPNIGRAGEYHITLNYENTDNVNVTVLGGKITVSKSTLTLAPPTLADGIVAIYGDKLGDLELSVHGNGIWSWKEPDQVVDHTGKFGAYVVFTPNNSSGYDITEEYIEIDVSKKELAIAAIDARFVYAAGKERSISYIITDKEDSDIVYSNDDVPVNIVYRKGGVIEAPINAGAYIVSINIVDDRYFGSATGNIVIEKATPDWVDFDKTFEITWSAGGRTLGNITSLPAGYSWINNQTKIEDTNINTAVEYAVIYTPDDTDNYNTVVGAFKVFMKKAAASIAAQDSYEFAYGKVAPELGITASHDEANIVYTDLDGDAFDIASIKNVGTYKFVAMIAATEHYEAASKEITVTIVNAAFPNTSAPHLPAATYGDTLADVQLPASDDGVWSWNDALNTSVGNAGSRAFVMTFTPYDENYVPFEVTANLVVNKRKLTLALGETAFVYDGTEKLVTVEIIGFVGQDSVDSVELVGVEKQVNAGSYPFSVAIVSDNYESDPVDGILVINKADYAPDEPDGLVAIYGDLLSGVALPDGWEWDVLDGTKVGNAGANGFKARFDLCDSNYNAYETTLYVEVAKKTVELTAKDSSVVYNGAEQTSAYENGALYTVDNAKATDVGSYNVEFTLVDSANYEWADGKNTVTFSIMKADNAWTIAPALNKTAWTFGEAAAVLTNAVSKLGTVKITLDGAEYSSMPASAGSYVLVVKVEGNDNYTGLLESFNITISKKTVDLPATDSNVAYNGAEQEITYTKSVLYTVANEKATNVGEKTVVFTLVDADNYEWAGVSGDTYTVKFEITKADNAWTIAPALNKTAWTFGEAAAVLTNAVSKFGTVEVTLDGAEYSSMPTSAGSYVLVVKVEGNDNYTGLEEEIAFEIAKADNAWTIAPALNKTAWTFGEAAAVLTKAVSKFGTVKITLDGAEYSSMPASAGSYVLVVKVEGNDNYMGLEERFNIEISKFKLNTPVFTSVYNGKAQEAILPANETRYVIKTNAINAVEEGVYDVILELTDPDNYEWKDSSDVTCVAKLSITHSINAWITEPEFVGDNEWTYGEAGATLNVGTAEFGIPTVTINGILADFDENGYVVMPTAAGSYVISVEVVGNDNYTGLDEITFTVVIETVKVSLPDDVTDITVPYNGEEQRTEYADGDFYTVDNAKGTGVGEYTAVFTLKDSANYEWVGADTVKLTITKADNAWITEPALDKNAWIFGEASAVLTNAVSKFGTVEVTLDGAEYSSMPTSAGSYVLVVKVEGNDNYTGLLETFNITISKKTVDLPAEDVSVVYNGKEQKTEYANCEIYAVENARGTDVGEYTVTFTLLDTDNYEWTDGKNTVLLVITSAKVAAPEVIATVPYSGNQNSATSANDLYVVTGYELNDRKDVGEYTVYLTLVDTHNYEWDNGVNTTKLIVEKVTPALSAPTIAGWIYKSYNAVTNAPSASVSNISGVSVQYSYWNGETEITDLAGLVPGEYTLRAAVVGNDNYDDATTEATFKVSKITINVPSVTGSYTYNGNPITPTVAKSDYYTVIENTEIAAAGENEVVLQLNDAELYMWSGENGDSATVTLKFTVSKAQTTVSVAITGWSYGASANVPTIGGVVYDSYRTVKYTGTTNAGVAYDSTAAPTAAGSYTITVTVAATDNSIGSEATADFTVARKTLDIPNGIYSATYTGSEQKPDVGALYNVEGATGAGSHTLTVSIKDTDNYEWSSTAAVADKTVTFTIGKANPTLTITASNVTYTGSAYGGLSTSCTIAGVTINYYYFKDEAMTQPLDGVPVDAGVYYVYAEIVGTDNYTGVTTGSKEFTINPATPDVNFYDYNAGERYQNNIALGGIAVGPDGNRLSGAYTYDPAEPNVQFKPSISPESQGVYYRVTFTPQDTNYTSVTAYIVVYLKPAAYITINGVTTYYGSIEDALLATATNNAENEIVWAVIDKSDVYSGGNVIKYNCVIPAGVTLVIPYEKDVKITSHQAPLHGRHYYEKDGPNGESIYDKAKDDNGKYTVYTGVYLHVTNTVTVAPGVVIINSGNLEVVGELSGGSGGSNYASFTAGATAQLVLSDGAEIKNDGGVIKVFGFIEELTKNNGSKVTLNSGTAYIPIVIEHRGGTNMSAVNNGGKGEASPFNRLSFNNVMPTLQVGYNATLIGIANLYAKPTLGTAQVYVSESVLVSKSAAAVIQLDTADSKLVAKYDKDTLVSKLDVYGGATTHGMTISVQGINISTVDFAFPISYQFDISLKPAEGGQSATYTMGQLFKLLPGARLVVESGVTLNIHRMNLLGKDYVDPCGTLKYPNNGKNSINPNTKEVLEGAMLIIYGHLNLITVDNVAPALGGNVYVMPGGTTCDLTGQSCTTKELISADNAGLTYEFATPHNQAVNVITSGVSLTLNPNGGKSSFVVTAVADGKYPVLPTPTRYGYDFLGWYYGNTLVTKGTALKSTEAHTLVAKWKEKVIITLDSMGADAQPDVFSKDGKYPTLPTPSKEGFSFLGWYFAGVNVNAGDALKSTEAHTLVAKWKAEIRVSFVSDGAVIGDYVVITNGKYPASLPTPTRSGYTFTGWYFGTTKVSAGKALAINASHYLTAGWEKKLDAYTVTFDGNGVASPESMESSSGSAITLPTMSRTGYTFAGWYDKATGGNKIGDGGASYTPTADITLYAQWTVIKYGVTIKTSSATITVKLPDDTTVSNGGTIAYGTSVSVTVTFSKSSNKTFTVTDASGKILSASEAGTYTFTMPAGDVTIEASSSSSCVTPDTIITLADGTKKRIDAVLPTDMLLVWNFYTGEYDVAPASIIMNHGYDEYTVVTLKFADGTEINTINGHGFFDVDANEYVIIDKNNVTDYLGQSFVRVDGNGYSTTELVDFTISVKYTESWSVLTVKHYNCILENMWTITPAEVEGSPEYLMPFEIEEGMRYDEAKMQSDIETYGLFTYDDFAEYMSEEQYNALGLDIWKVSIGKGYVTWDDILYLIGIHIG